VNVNSDVSDVTVIPSSSVDHAIGSFSYYNLSDPPEKNSLTCYSFG
jgi:hypothetical protein